MMPNQPTLLRQYADRPPTLSHRITALIRAECGREQISMTALAAMSGLSYHKVRTTLHDKRPVFLGELHQITQSLGLGISNVFQAATDRHADEMADELPIV